MDEQPLPARLVAWKPQDGPQTAAITCPVPDLLYGGARGGGKTDYLLGDIASKAGIHGKAFRGLFLRRTLKEMEEVHRRAGEIYPKIGATWSASTDTWTFPTGGSCRFRYLDEDRDADQYMGFNLTYLAVDEVGNFPSPAPIDKLWGSLRSPEGIPVYRRMTGNPGGVGHAWINERYIRHGPYKIIRWQPQPELAPHIWMESVFIPSKLEDNQILMRNDPNYELRLAMVGDSKLYKAWREGDWNVLAGAYFEGFGAQCISSCEAPPWSVKFAACDWGYSHDSAVYWGAWDGERLWIYREMVQRGLDPKALAQAIFEQNGGDRLERFYLSPDAFAHRQSERSIATEMGDMFASLSGPAGHIPMPNRADNERISGWQLMGQMMREKRLMIDPGCRILIDKIPTAVRDNRPGKSPEDILKVDGDDALDAARYLILSRARDPFEPEELRVGREFAGISDPNTIAMKHRIMSARGLISTPGSSEMRIVGRRPGRW